MLDAPSPRARRLAPPGWLNARLVLGVLLVLASVVAGARLLAAADRSELVWVAARDLAAGSPVREADLVPARVRLFEGAHRYVTADRPLPPGYLLRRGLGQGELLPAAALAQANRDVDVREVTVDVAAGHWPPSLAAGEQVDVYVTPDRDAPAAGGAAGAAQSRLVLAAVPVADVPRAEGFGAGGPAQQVVLSVPPPVVLRLVQAAADGNLDLVRVPRPAEQGTAADQDGRP